MLKKLYHQEFGFECFTGYDIMLVHLLEVLYEDHLTYLVNFMLQNKDTIE